MITTHKTKDREIAFVLLPEGAKEPRIRTGDFPSTLVFTTANRNIHDWIQLPDGKWNFVSLSQSITEEQAAGIVETVPNMPAGFIVYENYIETDRYTNTALESFLSLMESLRLYHKNPELDMSHWKDKLAIPSREALVNYNKWSEAQARTGNYAVLVRELENQ